LLIHIGFVDHSGGMKRTVSGAGQQNKAVVICAVTSIAKLFGRFLGRRSFTNSTPIINPLRVPRDPANLSANPSAAHEVVADLTALAQYSRSTRSMVRVQRRAARDFHRGLP